MNLNDIRKYSARLDRQQDAVDEEKDSLKLIYDEAKANGIRPDAFKSARKLKKLKPVDLRAWLATFDACREALGLDAQMDIEDAAADPKVQRAVKKVVDSVQRGGGAMEIKPSSGKGVRIEAGEDGPTVKTLN